MEWSHLNQNTDRGKNFLQFLEVWETLLKLEIPTFIRLNVCSSAFVQLQRIREAFSLLLCSTKCINLTHEHDINISTFVYSLISLLHYWPFKLISWKTLICIFYFCSSWFICNKAVHTLAVHPLPIIQYGKPNRA